MAKQNKKAYAALRKALKLYARKVGLKTPETIVSFDFGDEDGKTVAIAMVPLRLSDGNCETILSYVHGEFAGCSVEECGETLNGYQITVKSA